MLDFVPVTPDMYEEASECLKKAGRRGCEYSFANNYAWREFYGTRICIYKGFYIFMTCTPVFSFPAGDVSDRDTLAEVIGLMREYAAENDMPFVIYNATEEDILILKELFGGEFTYSPDEDSFDYIYEASALAQLGGRKYHSKRNHLAKIENYSYEYSALKSSDFDDCIDLAARLYRENGTESRSLAAEQTAVRTFFECFDRFSLSGGILRIDGKAAAFTIGERILPDTLDIHIEKADIAFDGTYAAINSFYAQQAVSGYEGLVYINREEDMGIEGLRKAKRSYHPAFMLKKHAAVFGKDMLL